MLNLTYIIYEKMDESFTSDNEDIGDNIRPADNVKREILQEDTRSEYQKQIDEAIHLSSLEYIENQKNNSKYEKEIIENYHKVSNERKENFCDFLFDVNKLIRFDKEIKEIYEIIEPIIDAYCSQFIEICELDSITYDRIFKALKGIRTNKNSIELLKTILIRNE